ncbi:MAG: accessory Sec system protein Asp2, partial [Schaedlerella arabinosiphila]|nr:accessory Sec system protein Asp2 [Schaedlerella arabinosiphila]
MAKIQILQLGNEDWNEIYTLPEGVTLDYAEEFTEPPEKAYDLFFLDRNLLEEEIRQVYRSAKAYTLFVTSKVDVRGRMEWLCRSRRAQHLPRADIQRFLTEETRFYFPRPYGEKFALRDVAVAHGFSGKVKWNGNQNILLEGDFGEEFRQAAYWRYNNPLPKGEAADFWLEYDKDPSVEIVLEVTIFATGTASVVLERLELSEKDLEQVVRLESSKGNGTLFFSVKAKGRGRLWLTGLHKRLSRGSHGYFLPGGERYVTSSREEAFCYFDPGDLKPPLNVYFSGYKTLEGFEGYFMVKA